MYFTLLRARVGLYDSLTDFSCLSCLIIFLINIVIITSGFSIIGSQLYRISKIDHLKKTMNTLLFYHQPKIKCLHLGNMDIKNLLINLQNLQNKYHFNCQEVSVIIPLF